MDGVPIGGSPEEEEGEAVDMAWIGQVDEFWSVEEIHVLLMRGLSRLRGYAEGFDGGS